MRFELKEVSICAEKEFELIRITDPVREFVAQTGVKNGVVYVITEHTTTGIMVNESLPCVEKDIMETLDRIAPEDYPYHHNHYLPTYGTIGGNAPGHLKSLLTGNHCVFPIAEGKINTEPLITHTYPLERIEEAYELFENKRDGVIKVAVEC